jgi:RNA polymerase sigma-70 factor, ECF subfamily
MTEQELISGILANNREAIRLLVTTYQKRVIKTAYYFVSDMQDAEDLSQEVFLEVIRSIRRYQRRSSLYTWIYRITVNKSMDHLRKQNSRKFILKVGNFLGFSEHESGSVKVEHALSSSEQEEKEKRKILETAILSLAENQRIAFTLSKYDELSYKEISEIMNLSLSSVESLIHRAKINLQKKLVNHFSEYAKTRKKQ